MMIINNRFTLSFVLALAAVTAPSSVQANTITNKQKREWRRNARRAAQQCEEYQNQSVLSRIIVVQKCTEGGHTATVAIRDKGTKVELGLVKFACDSTTKVMCGPRCGAGHGGCADDAWCSPFETFGYSVCVDYVAIGESCSSIRSSGQGPRCNPATSVCVYPSHASLMASLPGTCEVECKGDRDCGENQWCQLQDNTIAKPSQKPMQELSICVDYAGEDESCSSYNMIEDQRRCNPNAMECIVEDPMLTDAPGKCKLRCESGQGCGEGKACNEGLCFDTCDGDEDCPNDNYWCRAKRNNNVSVCTLVVGEGETCGAIGYPSMEERCSKSLSCMENPNGSNTCQVPAPLPVDDPTPIDEGNN